MARTKKQRKEDPLSVLDNESLACVASPSGPIRTPVVCNVTKEIVLDRLDKEICKPFQFSLSVPRQQRQQVLRPDGTMETIKRPAKRLKTEATTSSANAVLKSRLKIGTNECTRALEKAVAKDGPAPSLVLLARDVHPPTILAHIPYLAKQVGTPILLLPGKASWDLGRTLGTKKVTILLFMPTQDKDDEHSRIDSLVDFIKSKVPE